jgi:hypothetical protein
MEAKLPGSGKRKPGSGEVISFRCSSRRFSLSPHEIPSEKDRFSRPESSPYTFGIASAVCWRNTIGNTVKNAASVTTSHLFRPNQRRKANVRYGISNRIRVTLNHLIPTSDNTQSIRKALFQPPLTTNQTPRSQTPLGHGTGPFSPVCYFGHPPSRSIKNFVNDEGGTTGRGGGWRSALQKVHSIDFSSGIF